MGIVYAIANQKGGVGKTTTTINLGAYLAENYKNVLLVDIDPQANATASIGVDKDTIQGGTYEALLGIESAKNKILHNPRLKLDLLPSTPALAGASVELVNEEGRELYLKEAIEPLIDKYDYVLIDCPPALGILTLNGLVAAKDGVIIPVQCEYLALEGLGQLMQTLNRIRSSVSPDLSVRGLLLTMFDPRTNLSSDVVDEVRRHFPNQVFNSVVPRSVRLAEAPSYGIPISIYDPNSTGAKAYKELAKEMLAADEPKVPAFAEA
ncbi:MAG: ParA family protein [Anaerolineales bacterium]|nr:ParA family protein [Chloroflexota bacterium]MBL7161389.1 ParA family protein [Anaerolineales bacterium]